MMISPSFNEKYIPHDLIGNETHCKKKFAKMILAAYKYQQDTYEDDLPVQIKLLFDVNGNVDMMRIVKKQNDNSLTSEYHKFCGNSQYVPPELSTHSEYSSELGDVWVLGIFLYRMLVGKYPFIALNDKQLFQKMVYGDFHIPDNLSSDVTHLLRSMLSPNSTRPSLDLIIYHPWLHPYRTLLLEQFQPPLYTSLSQSPPPLSMSYHPFQQEQQEKKKNVVVKLFLFITKGPFPPP